MCVCYEKAESPYSKDLAFLFPYSKCLETGKRPNPLKTSLFSRNFVVSSVFRHFPYSKCLETEITMSGHIFGKRGIYAHIH